MSNGLIDLEDEMYRLYVKFYPNGKPARIGFDALPSCTVSLISRYPDEAAHVIASSVYRLTRRVFFSPFTVERHTPRSFIRLRTARTQVYCYDSQPDLALAIRHVISTPAEPEIIQEIACMAFKNFNQPSLNLDLDSLRESSESLAIAVHKLTRANPC
ncbi:hypothetical protein ALP05_00682 [Pseudomonas caricapapayae]|uniref:Uncharacterized protein n=1 Tax=Pseudomonas caricapapayae TaxID=46678 RepID=A0A3M6F734_9PSED|nr:hypothetical protein [Pseudomonas caricapapayae]RMV76445.1 hypothetical protein ALP05_00682 [Pseudomonas caricapapayae]